MDDREDTDSLPADPLETLLRGHLRAGLEPKVGLAERRFLREINRGRRRSGSRLAIWALWATGSAMAASVGIVWGVIQHRATPAHMASRPDHAATVASAQGMR